MTSRRPGLITLIAASNLLLGLLGAGALAASAYVDFTQFTRPPEPPPPPEPAVNPENGPPRLAAAPALPTLPNKEPAIIEIPRPIEPRANPVGYFRARQHYLIRQVITYELFVMALVPLCAVLVVFLWGSGLGLLAMRPYGRKVAIWFSLMAPLVLGLSAAYSFRYVVPDLRRWDDHRSYLYRGLGEEPPPQISVKLVYAVEGVSLLLGAIYPLLLLWTMQRPSIRAALQPTPTPTPSPVNEEMPPAAAIPPPEPVPAAGV
jgi:hypothetical protein